MTAPEVDFGALLRAGDLVYVDSGAAEPVTLLRRLVDQRHRLPRVRLLLGYGFVGTIRPEHLDALDVTVLGGYGANAALTAAGADVLPCRMADLPMLLQDGTLRVDVALLSCTPPGENGDHSLGVTTDLGLQAAHGARAVVAELVDRMPWTRGDTVLRSGLVTASTWTARPIPDLDRPDRGPADDAIAEQVAGLIADRSVLQLGIGRVPEAVAARLGGHRDLGIHSGFLGDWAMDLVESGAVTNAYKTIDRGLTVGGTLMGTQRLYQWAHDNPSLLMRDARYTHGADVLARLETLVSVNSAIEVDLTGQVNAEVIGDRYVGAVGGQVDYVRAAAAAPRGRSVIALPATTARSGRSRIVPRLNSAVVTTARSDVDVVVTEYGTAHLRGRSLGERVRRMIAVAAPECRDELARAADAI